MSKTHQLVISALALVALTSLSACGDQVGSKENTANPAAATTDGCSLDAHVRGLAIVLPVHQGSAGRMPEQFQCTIRAAIERGLPIRVVTAEGTPTIAVKLQAQPDPVNPVAFEDDVANAEADLIAQVDTIRASSNGNDTWGALTLAADELTSIGAGGRQGLILSRANGNSDSGLLRMTDPDMTQAEPKDVAQFITKNTACGQLKAMTVNMYGLGETVAPHPSLSARQKVAIAAQYTAALTACGAKATSQPLPATGAGPKTEYVTQPVTPDKPATIHVTTREPVTLRQDTLGYLPDQAAFIDPAQARKVLADLARQLKANPDIHVEIRGRTAAGPTSWPSLRALGKARADLCAHLLRDLGVHPTQISTHGDGYLAKPPINSPATAAANRATQFTFNNQ